MSYRTVAAAFALALSFAAPSAAQRIDAGYTGSWFNPATGGHGVNLEILSPTQAALAWYTFDPEGSPVFLVGAGTIEGNRISANVVQARGMQFGSFAPAATLTPWGTLELTFADCGNGTLSWTSAVPGYANGTQPLARLTGLEALDCGKRPASGLYSGFLALNTGGQVGLTGLLDEGGNFYGLANDQSAIYFGSYATDGTAFTLAGTAVAVAGFQFPGGATTASFPGAGSFRERDSITFTTTNAIASGTASLLYDIRYERGSSLARIAGSYSSTIGPGQTLAITITPAGQLGGQATNGCRFDGTIAAPTPAYNAYTANVAITSCTGADGTYEGVATLLDWSTFGDSRNLVIGLRNAQRAIVQSLVRP